MNQDSAGTISASVDLKQADYIIGICAHTHTHTIFYITLRNFERYSRELLKRVWCAVEYLRRLSCSIIYIHEQSINQSITKPGEAHNFAELKHIIELARKCT